MDRFADYAAGTFAKPGYTMDTQIVVNDLNPQGERIFIMADGDIIARVPMAAGTSYGIVCQALLDGFANAGVRIWDRDDQMNYRQSVTGKAA